MKLTRTHIILFILTVLTTLITGYTFSSNIYDAILFSVSLILILGCHEMGHYYYGRKYNVDITPPYFIPAPPFLSIIGTFGAFIKIKSTITSKKALFDIGIAGPIAGLITAIPVIIIGLRLSEAVLVKDINMSGNMFIVTGDNLIFKLLSSLCLPVLPDGYEYLNHPMAFAGWIGLFVTALNLIPYGQLDGGHILYSLFPRKIHKNISFIILAILLVLGSGTKEVIRLLHKFYLFDLNNNIIEAITFDGWSGWLVWAVLLIALGYKHPPTQTDHIEEMDSKRKILGIIALLIFVGCFTPVPIIISDSLH